MVAIYIQALNTINIVIYRPPKALSEDFYYILEKVEEILSKMGSPNPIILMTGDFNFPFIEWNNNNNSNCFNGCIYKYNFNINTTIEDKMQFERLNRISEKYNLIQAIDAPTREENGKQSTLDLVFTNDIDICTEIGVYKSCMSDHHTIEISTPYNPEIEKKSENINESVSTLRELNFYSKDIDWKKVNNRLSEIPWDNVKENKSTLELNEFLITLVIKICTELIPKKGYMNKDASRRIPKVRRKLLGRMKMLKRGRRKAVSNTKKDELDKKIQEVESQLIDERKKERIKSEKKIVDRIKTNPKVLYSYMKKENGKRKEIGPFKEGNKYIYDNEEICKMLVKQFKKQFSNPGNTATNQDYDFHSDNDNDLTDIEITDTAVQKAISEMDENSSAGPDDIPALFLIKTKETISTPLRLILRKSLDEGFIPNSYKLANITPIHKGGVKTKPEQYRPVSLTSHIMKVFERVLKNHILQHLIKNNLINEQQHGFVPGRSCQSQLLVHFKDIYEALEEGVQVDTVFLDFSKAFDKVNHSILLKKVAEHGIKGKIGSWIREFLMNRKFTVIANGHKSEQEDVMSGVPQGTVLAALLFIVMISDIDEDIKECIVRCFADDTRVSKKIEKDEDKQKLQDGLNKIYKWSEDNLMMFNENKFEQLSYGETKNVQDFLYRNPLNEEIKRGKIVKDLGVVTSSDLSFKEHIQSITLSCRIISGMILRTFHTREPEVMIKLFHTYIRSKMEYCCSIWSPNHQGEINELERIQKSFTCKIQGMEDYDYHQRLKKLRLYSLERRRERYLIIYAWQMLEGIKVNYLNLQTNNYGRSRTIYSRPIRWGFNGRKIKHSDRSRIHGSTSKNMARLFNSIPPYLRNMQGKTTETFKLHLDKWLESIPDTPKIDNYGSRVVAESNSIVNQAVALTVRQL